MQTSSNGKGQLLSSTNSDYFSLRTQNQLIMQVNLRAYYIPGYLFTLPRVNSISGSGVYFSSITQDQLIM